MPRSEHYQNLDAVRGIAAQVVVVVHVFILMGATEDAPRALTGWGGRLAVLVFFCLSGFVIATTIQRGFARAGGFDWSDYAIRRFARIYPPYLASILAVAALVALVPGREPFAPAEWLRTLTFTFLRDDPLPVTNIAIWSLRIEVILYAVAGCMALSLAKTAHLHRIVWTVLGGLGLLALFLFFRIGATAAALFGFGALAALLRHRLRPPLIVGFACFAFAALLPLSVPLLAGDVPPGLAYQGLIGVPIGIWLISLAQVPAAAGWAGRMLINSGGWSYTLYILHAPTLVALNAALNATVGSYGGTLLRRAAIIGCGLLVANLVAYGVALLVERPSQFARWTRQVLAARARRPVLSASPGSDR